MKTIGGLATLIVGLIIAGYGISNGSWLLIGVGIIMVYTGYKVIAS